MIDTILAHCFVFLEATMIPFCFKPPLSLAQKAALSLVLLIITFATLVPGGPIETRDFSQLDPLVFWGFNLLLMAMGLTGLTLSYGMWRGRTWSLRGSIGLAWMYLTVFILDWAMVFPPSSDPMGLSLALVEIFGAMCCAYVLGFAHRSLVSESN
jgi:hypothetical protein